MSSLTEKVKDWANKTILGDSQNMKGLEAKSVLNLLSDEEFLILDEVRKIRNKIFHESQYGLFYAKGGIEYPFSEDVTKREIFNDFSYECFRIVLKLLHEMN